MQKLTKASKTEVHAKNCNRETQFKAHAKLVSNAEAVQSGEILKAKVLKYQVLKTNTKIFGGAVSFQKQLGSHQLITECVKPVKHTAIEAPITFQQNSGSTTTAGSEHVVLARTVSPQLSALSRGSSALSI